jgi:endonuclease YncB( thermonuclease family)
LIRLPAAAGLTAALLASASAAPAQDRSACHLEPLGTGVAQTAIDGRTLTLADGREVRLSGLAPLPDRHEAAARDALGALLTGRDLALSKPGVSADRYGRIEAQVFVVGEPRPVQQALLAQGQARVDARVGDMGCAAELLAAERIARAAGLGLWAGDANHPLHAENFGEVLAQLGRFVLVEGTVLSVRESGGTIYVNFGRRWTEDFTVTVQKRSERVFGDAGLVLKSLAGRSVRVRGTVEERGGPWIEATRPEQIEVIR